MEFFTFQWITRLDSISKSNSIFHSLQVRSPTFRMLTQSTTWTSTFHGSLLYQPSLQASTVSRDRLCNPNRHFFLTWQIRSTKYHYFKNTNAPLCLLLTHDVTILPSNHSPRACDWCFLGLLSYNPLQSKTWRRLGIFSLLCTKNWLWNEGERISLTSLMMIWVPNTQRVRIQSPAATPLICNTFAQTLRIYYKNKTIVLAMKTLKKRKVMTVFCG